MDNMGRNSRCTNVDFSTEIYCKQFGFHYVLRIN